jgi:phosphatidylserine decarboxylase
MKPISFLTFYDRAAGKVISEPVFASRFLTWSYNTTLGFWLTKYVLRQKLISKLYGWVHKSRWSRKKIQPFVKKMNVNMKESLIPQGGYSSFNDFFIREIDLSCRPFVKKESVCIAPCDGRVLAYPVIKADRTFQIKQSAFNLVDFLRDDDLFERFTGGSMLISRIYLTDYHHLYFPDSGVPHDAVSIPGKYYAIGPYSFRRLIPFYMENHRMLTIFDSDHFGRIAIIEVGAFTVGSIQQRFMPGTRVGKGVKKGFFELGGSTVVLLFQPRAIRFDTDLCQNTERGIETRVRLGDSIGTL